MGAAAVPIMIATTVVSTAGGIYSSQQQSKMAAEEQRARGRQAAAASKEEEIERLKLFKETQARNMAMMAAGGLASDSGTLAQINQGNIASMEEDVQGIRTTGKATQAYMNRGADNARKAGVMQGWTQGLQGAASIAGAYNTGKSAYTPGSSGWQDSFYGVSGAGTKSGVS